MRKFYFLVGIVAFLMGCGHDQQVKQLTSQVQPSFFTLESRKAFAIAGNLGAEYRVYIAEGKYQAVLESEQGVYYLGPKKALRMENGKMFAIAEGGIYLPHVESDSAMTWIYANTLQQFQNGTEEANINMAAVEAFPSDVKLQWDIPQHLKDSIQVVH